jgi:hypothetical protein
VSGTGLDTGRRLLSLLMRHVQQFDVMRAHLVELVNVTQARRRGPAPGDVALLSIVVP